MIGSVFKSDCGVRLRVRGWHRFLNRCAAGTRGNRLRPTCLLPLCGTDSRIGVTRFKSDWAGVRRLIRPGLVVLLTLVHASTAMAQVGLPGRDDIDTPGLVIEAEAGWDGTVDHSMPVPISFLINNYSNRLIEGHLILNDPMMGHETNLGEIVVSAGATRRFTTIQAMEEWYECFATLKTSEEILWRRELQITTGKEFDTDVNFALFIHDGGRELRLPRIISASATAATNQPVMAAAQGRPVECLTVKPWQVPNHPGPIVAAQAVIFPEAAPVHDLNKLQWQAISKWMCLGGTVFVHNKSREIMDRLSESAPLSHGPPVTSGEFTIRRVGLGAIYEYPRPLFSPDGSMRQLIAETTSQMTKHHIINIARSVNVYRRSGGRAELNRVLVVLFFGVYTCLCGGAVLLFRKSRRRVATYISVVVLGTCVLSGLLGAMLRVSHGDLAWATVTQAGAGGVVQVGNIEVQSAGGRATQVAIDGQHPDLQYIRRDNRYYYSRSNRTGYPPFTLQRSLRGDDDKYEINVPMTPWGRRDLHATAFAADLQQMDFKLEFEPSPSAASSDAGNESTKQSTTTAVPTGDFSLKLVNRLPFALTDCRLVIGVTSSSAPTVKKPAVVNIRDRGRGRVQITRVSNSMNDLYHIKELGSFAKGEERAETFAAKFQVIRNRDLRKSWRNGSVTVPRISQIGIARAWIVGRIKKSPVMTIDRQHSDFVPRDELHVFIQEIRLEDWPDTLIPDDPPATGP